MAPCDWSPDGRRLFIDGSLAGMGSVIMLYEPETGKETMLAQEDDSQLFFHCLGWHPPHFSMANP